MSDVRDTELFSAYLDGEVTSAEQARVEQLLAVDPAARQLMDGLRALRGRLQSLPTEKLDEDLSQHVLRAAERRILLGDGGRAAAEPADKAQPAAKTQPAELPLWRQIGWRGMFSRRALTWSGIAVAVAAWLALTNPNPPARDDDRAVALQDDKRPEKAAAEAAEKRADDRAPAGGDVAEENDRRPIPAMHAPGWRDESVKETAADRPAKADEKARGEKTLDKKAEGGKLGYEGKAFADDDKAELQDGYGHGDGRPRKEIVASGAAPSAPRPATPAAETAKPTEDNPSVDNLLKDRVAENKKSSGDEAKSPSRGYSEGERGRQSLKMARKGGAHETLEAESGEKSDEAMSSGESPAQRQDSGGRGGAAPPRSLPGKAKDSREALAMKPSAGPAPAESTANDLKTEEGQADSALLLEQRKQQNAPNASLGLAQNGTRHLGKRGGNENMGLGGGGQLPAAAQGSVRSQQGGASIQAMIVECEARPEAIEKQALEKLLARGGLTVVQRSNRASDSYSKSGMTGGESAVSQSADVPEGSDDASGRARSSAAARVVVVEVRATPQQVGVILAELGRNRGDFPSFAVRPAAVDDSRRLADREAMSRSAPASGLKQAEAGDFRLKSKGDGKLREQPADQTAEAAPQKAEQEKAPAEDSSYRIVFVLRVVDSQAIDAAAAERAKAADALREAAPAAAAPPDAKK